MRLNLAPSVHPTSRARTENPRGNAMNLVDAAAGYTRGSVVPKLPPLVREDTGETSVGYGRAMGHHGKILQGVFSDREGVLHRGLVTVPCPELGTWATFRTN